MSGRQHDIHGKPVPESEVAADLGFASIWELRRWSTGLGMQVIELEHALRTAKDERDRFRDVGQQMMGLLNAIKPALVGIHDGVDPTMFDLLRFIKAIGVASGHEADWGNDIRPWLMELQAAEQAKIDDALTTMRANRMTDDEVEELLS